MMLGWRAGQCKQLFRQNEKFMRSDGWLHMGQSCALSAAMPIRTQEPEFDEFAADYHAALQKGLRLTGEDASYYAEGRCRWTADHAARLGLVVQRVLDFGCGTGTATRFLAEAFPGCHVTGTDPSEASLEVARADHGGVACEFVVPSDLATLQPVDLAYCNGVFHHIPPEERAAAARSVFQAVKPGGLFALWENNPWNPMVWYVMSRVPFDKDAIMLWPGETEDLLKAAGFQLVTTRFGFVFPSFLSALRPLEPLLSPWPLGGQYVVLARRP
jgi:SAM-dependent methyltransferase